MRPMRRIARLRDHLGAAAPSPAAAASPEPERDGGGSILARMHSPAEDGSRGPGLTESDCAFFKANGYLVKRSLFTEEELAVCIAKFWAAAPEGIEQHEPDSWKDPDRHAAWATPGVPGYERMGHNRGGYRWTLHELGTDPEFLAATAHNPKALRVVEGLIGGPVKVPGRNRGIYAIFPMTDENALGPHVDSHTFECQMVTYLGPVDSNGGGFTMWPGSHELVYRAHAEALNWSPTDDFPIVMEKCKREIQPVQMTGDVGDCIFTHHRVVHSAGSNTGENIRMGVFTDYEKVRPPAPIVWRVNGREMQSDGTFSRYGLGGGAPHEKDPGADGEELTYAVPWWDDNLEFAPTHPPHEDMWEEWNLGKAPVSSRPGVNTR